MISSEVQRTLVKSPPELWAELSNPAALARHLGELGEIRITRVEPETTVEWEAQDITGTVCIKPSGWGTRVTLSVRRQLSPALAERPGEPQCQAPPPALAERPGEPRREPSTQVEGEAHAHAQGEARAEGEGEASACAQGEARAEGEGEATAEPQAVTESVVQEVLEASPDSAAPALAEPDTPARIEPAAAMPEVESQPRRGFFARLFGRRRKAVPAVPMPRTTGPGDASRAHEGSSPEAAPGGADAFAAVRDALSHASSVLAHAFEPPVSTQARPPGQPTPAPTQSPPSRPQATELLRAPDESSAEEHEHEHEPADLSAELLAAEEAAAEHVTAVLTAVLDRLGAAHHRPFSRA